MPSQDKLDLNKSIIVAIVAGLIGLFSNAYINYLESENTLFIEKEKLKFSIQLEGKKRHTSLILNATSQNNPQDVVKNLKFFIDIGLVTGPDAVTITAFLDDPMILDKIPSLDSSLKELRGTGRYTGTVKWFNSAKGFGFIEADDGPDLFLHFSALIGKEGELKDVKEGQRVQYSITEGAKGPQAEQVLKLPNS